MQPKNVFQPPSVDSSAQPHGEGPCFLVGFDFTDHSARALNQALRLAAAWPSSTVHVLWAGVSPDEYDAAVPRLKDHLDATLSSWSGSGWRFPDAKIVAHVTEKAAADAICEQAFLEGAHVILVGTRGRGRLQEVALGSVAKDVLAQAPCSVLVCVPRQADSVPKIDPPRADGGSTLGRRHVYSYRDKNAATETNFPLLFPM